ncbi:hypothetical protein ACJX0J_012388, partial [Zea mays]
MCDARVLSDLINEPYTTTLLPIFTTALIIYRIGIKGHLQLGEDVPSQAYQLQRGIPQYETVKKL